MPELVGLVDEPVVADGRAAAAGRAVAVGEHAFAGVVEADSASVESSSVDQQVDGTLVNWCLLDSSSVAISVEPSVYLEQALLLLLMMISDNEGGDRNGGLEAEGNPYLVYSLNIVLANTLHRHGRSHVGGTHDGSSHRVHSWENATGCALHTTSM